MSLICFDYRCPSCDLVYDNVRVERDEVDKQRCGSCHELLKRLPAGPPTTFKFGDRSAVKSKKAVSLRDANPGVARPMRNSDV